MVHWVIGVDVCVDVLFVSFRRKYAHAPSQLCSHNAPCCVSPPMVHIWPCICSRHRDKSGNSRWKSSQHIITKTHDYEVLLALFKTSPMSKGATWKWIEPASEIWGECRMKRRGGAVEREGAMPGAIVLSVSCWRDITKKTGGLWHITCLSHSVWLFALLFTHTLSKFTLGDVWLLCIFLSPNAPPPYICHSWSFAPMISPTTSLVYPLQIQTPSLEAGWVGGIRQAYRCRKKRMAGGGGGDPWLSPRYGGHCKARTPHTCPLAPGRGA